MTTLATYLLLARPSSCKILITKQYPDNAMISAVTLHHKGNLLKQWLIVNHGLLYIFVRLIQVFYLIIECYEASYLRLDAGNSVTRLY